MRKRSVLLVSPKGTRVQALGLPLWAVIVLFLMAVAGIVGYFIPLDRLIFTEQELAQKMSVVEQNERLQSNIGATLKTLSDLNERTERLEIGREKHKDIIGLPIEPIPAKQPQKAPAAALSSSSVLRHIGESEKLIAKFAVSLNEENQNLFDAVPVTPPVAPSASAMSRKFGMGRDPFTGKQKMHYGADFAAATGTPVIATAAGVVRSVENDPIWGRRVTITHGHNFRTVYAHLGTVRVAQGRAVKRGEEIGTVGMTGLTTGPHVHYEVWRNDTPINPEEYFFPTVMAQK
jgi:murein DD-endopeptidase MepM/ murein hydrolase activator NlpD